MVRCGSLFVFHSTCSSSKHSIIKIFLGLAPAINFSALFPWPHSMPSTLLMLYRRQSAPRRGVRMPALPTRLRFDPQAKDHNITSPRLTNFQAHAQGANSHGHKVSLPPATLPLNHISMRISSSYY